MAVLLLLLHNVDDKRSFSTIYKHMKSDKNKYFLVNYSD